MLLAEPKPPPSNMKRYSASSPKEILGTGPSTRLAFGTGKRATTILADQGDFVTVISDVPYHVRSRHLPPGHGKGTRHMHRTTLAIKTQPYSDYVTTAKSFHGGSSSQPPPPKQPQFSSQQISQIKFGREHGPHFLTHYGTTFMDAGVEPPAKLHHPSQVNKLNMNEGGGMKVSLDTADAKSTYRYWSQYNRIHNKLGAMLGNGVPRELCVRTSYNPLTGAEKGPAWQEQNRRISGNRILYNGHRKDADRYFVLG